MTTSDFATELEDLKKTYPAIESVLEFGSGEGVTYKILGPARYVGIDLRPRWKPENSDASVTQADVFEWTPPRGPWDLVVCDAHDGIDSPRLAEITQRQIDLALSAAPKLVAIDDCWVAPIRETALRNLGPPSRRSEAGTWLWVWALAGAEPWTNPFAPEHVRSRQPVMEIPAESGVRSDLVPRRPPDELPLALQGESFGIGVMSHRGSSNGRLSVLLSSIPENYPVLVSSDSIAEADQNLDHEVARHHGADFACSKPWGGRAKNARHVFERTNWQKVLLLSDDVWLFSETVRDALRWFVTLERHGVPLATLAVPGWETYREHGRWGFGSWAECLREPWRFEAVPPNPAFQRCPALFKNPFGASMLISRDAYDDLGGFAAEYWAHDDVWSHKVWTSGRWVSAAYPGRGYMHLGAQSWHHGESAQYVGSFVEATGMVAEESGRLQVEAIERWAERLGPIMLSLGGTPAV